MKKYNRNTMIDVPMDASFNSSMSVFNDPKMETKQKINAIGKRANSKLKSDKDNFVKPKQEAEVEEKFENDLQDLEKIQEENLQNYRYKHRRNRVVIIFLSVLLILAIASIVTYYIIVKLQTNCNMFVYGARASYIIDGIETDEFRTPAGLQGNMILVVDIQLRIEESGSFKIKFNPRCYKNNKLLDQILIHDANFDLFYEGGDGYYYSRGNIEGNQTIKLCSGVIMDGEYDNSLTTDNFKMNFYTYLEKV